MLLLVEVVEGSGGAELVLGAVLPELKVRVTSLPLASSTAESTSDASSLPTGPCAVLVEEEEEARTMADWAEVSEE